MTTTKTKRILALDILRGITICGMILVNNPGSGYVFAPLEHAQWSGLTPTDLIFPFFMFIMGISTFISLRKYNFAPEGHTFRKIVKRTLGIYLVGLLIGCFAHFCYYWGHADPSLTFWEQLGQAAWVFPTLRFSGVLARLAVCYGLTAIIAITVNHKRIPYIILTLLVGYFFILMLGNGYCYGADNILSIVDRAVIGLPHMWDDNNVDPEGLLSTLPALAHVLLGFYIGKKLLSGHLFEGEKLETENHSQFPKQVLFLLLVGAVLTFSGFLLNYGCPINKKVWSPTFVLTTCGLASTLLGLLIYVVDLKGHVRWGRFFEAFGVNPLYLFVQSDIFAILLGAIHVNNGSSTISLHGFFCDNLLTPVFGDYGGSLAYALLFVLLNWVIGYQLYKRKIYIKL
ncbi:MAG: DUF5009 domain-containing protein [Prevotella sp.]|jgi:predicted acyltransferase